MGPGIPKTALPRQPDEGLWEFHTHSNRLLYSLWLFHKHNILTSIFQMFKLDRRSQQEFPSASMPLNPKPAALCTASAVVF